MKTNAINLFNFVLFISFSCIFIKNWFIYKDYFLMNPIILIQAQKKIYKSLHYLNFYL